MDKKVKPNVKKPKESKITLNLFNIVLQPVASQSPERYKDLLKKIFEDKITCYTYGDKVTQIYSLEEFDGLIYGDLVNCTKLNSND